MRYVVPNPYHLWAHEAQTHARNSTSNRSFEGTDAYSYHTVVARIVRNAKGERAFLVATRSYSVTTAKHMSEIHHALRGQGNIFNVPNLCPNLPPCPGVHGGRPIQIESHNENVKAYWSKIADLAGKAKRARVNGYWHTEHAQQTLAELREYVRFFRLKGKQYKVPSDLADIDQTLADLAEASTKAKAKAAKEAREREKQREKDAAESLAKWMAGEYVMLPWLEWSHLRYSADGLRVETSHGADVPADHAAAALRQLLPLVKAKKAYRPEYPQVVRIGHYTLHSVDDAGNVRIGCHQFRRDEVIRFASIVPPVVTPAEVAPK